MHQVVTVSSSDVIHPKEYRFTYFSDRMSGRGCPKLHPVDHNNAWGHHGATRCCNLHILNPGPEEHDR